jgi:hypothetical protein
MMPCDFSIVTTCIEEQHVMTPFARGDGVKLHRMKADALRRVADAEGPSEGALL